MLIFYKAKATVIIMIIVISGVRVIQSLVVYVCFVDRCLSFCTFSFDHCALGFPSVCGC